MFIGHLPALIKCVEIISVGECEKAACTQLNHCLLFTFYRLDLWSGDMQSVGKGGVARVFQHVISERGSSRRKQQKLAIKIIFLCSIVSVVNETW